jgi:hypothetical protein
VPRESSTVSGSCRQAIAPAVFLQSQRASQKWLTRTLIISQLAEVQQRKAKTDLIFVPATRRPDQFRQAPRPRPTPFAVINHLRHDWTQVAFVYPHSQRVPRDTPALATRTPSGEMNSAPLMNTQGR